MDVQATSQSTITPLTATAATPGSESRTNLRDAQTKEAVRAAEEKPETQQGKNRRSGQGVDITV